MKFRAQGQAFDAWNACATVPLWLIATQSSSGSLPSSTAEQRGSPGRNEGISMRVGMVLSVLVIVAVCVISDIFVMPLVSNTALRKDMPRAFYHMSDSRVSQPPAVSNAHLLPPIILNDSTCHYGGILTRQGCICGRMTEGLQCQHLTVSPKDIEATTMCGPTCWATYVWYHTSNFVFSPIKPEHEKILNVTKDVLAWQSGGELRRTPIPGAQPLDKVVFDMMTDLGPWTEKDKKMLTVLHEFRKDLPRVREAYESRIPRSQTPKESATIAYAMIVHKDSLQFQAFWDVMYSPKHYYLIHLDAESDDVTRKEIIRIIEDTPVDAGKSIWDRVKVVDPDLAVKAMWGDVTLIYLEVVMWIQVFLETSWEWDYFINMSGQDIPIVPLDYIEKYLGEHIPDSFVSYHENKEEFRQSHFTPERWDENVVVTLSTLQSEMPAGRWRYRHGQTRIYGCTQWHMLHYNFAYQYVSNPLVHGLMFSLKDTAIPDESFFATAAHWLVNKYNEPDNPVKLALGPGGDFKYRNEGVNRNLDWPGEFESLKWHSDRKGYMWARKAYAAYTTCHFTNELLGLKNNCTKYEHTKIVIKK